jgi:peptidoglycan/LPS O-acetylase OafA/YrhL
MNSRFDTGLFHEQINALTSVRFFAALLVLNFHFGAGFLVRIGAPEPVANLFRNGYLGVSLFFVLSGYILSHAHRRGRLTPRDLGSYGLARFARIYPVYALALLLALPVLKEPISAIDGTYVLLMIQAWAPPESARGFTWIMQAWTLSVEAFFYLLFPVLLVAIRQMPPRANLALSVSCALAIVTLGLPNVSPGVVTIPFVGSNTAVWLPVFRLPEFVLGMALYRLGIDYPRIPSVLGRSVPQLLIVASALAVLSLATTVHEKAVVTILVGLLILSLTSRAGVVSRVFASRILILLGGASYAMYILQGPVREICRAIIPAPWDQFVSPVATIAGSVVVFIAYEQPIRRFILRHLAGRPSAPEAPSEAVAPPADMRVPR